MSGTTIADAIQLGIESIQMREDLTEKKREAAIKLLTGLLKRDWYNNWDKDSIIKALFDYRERNGVAPTVTNLSEFGMPKNTTIETHFHMKASLLLKQLFPETKTRVIKKRNDFGFTRTEEWLSCFVEQFNKHLSEGITSGRQYDILRDPGTPAWETIARNCDISSWTDLMRVAGVGYLDKQKQDAKIISINRTSSPSMERLEHLISQRRILNSELNSILHG